MNSLLLQKTIDRFTDRDKITRKEILCLFSEYVVKHLPAENDEVQLQYTEMMDHLVNSFCKLKKWK